jgi:two-component sensor histidine kinase
MDTHQPGLAVICDLNGKIATVLRNDFGAGCPISAGMLLTELIYPKDETKMVEFLAAIAQQGAVIHWEMALVIHQALSVLSFNGGRLAEQFYISAAPALRDEEYYNQLSRLNNELANHQRELAKRNCELDEERRRYLVLSEQLQVSLKEKDVLLREIHHRVKNNLQVISSLLSLQAQSLNDPYITSLFKDNQNRIRSMALVHEKLYQSSNLAMVNIASYTQSLINELFNIYGGWERVCCELEISQVFMPVDQAIPFGLVVYELASNALKHAFPQGRSGTLWVKLHEHQTNELTLTIADDGVGLPAGFDLEQAHSLGLSLVHSLVQQLKGTVSFSSEHGTRFEIQFPHEAEHAPALNGAPK